VAQAIHSSEDLLPKPPINSLVDTLKRFLYIEAASTAVWSDALEVSKR
jgi:hypothetical protein